MQNGTRGRRGGISGPRSRCEGCFVLCALCFVLCASRGDAALCGLESEEEAIAFGACGFEVAGFEGIGEAYGFSCGGSERETDPPGSIVVHQMVVGIGVGAACGEVADGVWRGHALIVSWFLFVSWLGERRGRRGTLQGPGNQNAPAEGHRMGRRKISGETFVG